MKSSGFTLVEILIVVIILGILAAIVIPQFTQASSSAQASQLASDLQTVRSQLQLYKAQHGDNYPTNMLIQLVNRTDISGTTGSDANLFPYGPYLQKFPTNPFVTSNGNTLEVGAGTPGDGTVGWYWNTATCTLSPNDSAHSGM